MGRGIGKGASLDLVGELVRGWCRRALPCFELGSKDDDVWPLLRARDTSQFLANLVEHEETCRGTDRFEVIADLAYPRIQPLGHEERFRAARIDSEKRIYAAADSCSRLGLARNAPNKLEHGTGGVHARKGFAHCHLWRSLKTHVECAELVRDLKLTIADAACGPQQLIGHRSQVLSNSFRWGMRCQKAIDTNDEAIVFVSRELLARYSQWIPRGEENATDALLNLFSSLLTPHHLLNSA